MLPSRGCGCSEWERAIPCIRDQFNSVGNMKRPGDEAASRGMGKATKRARRQRSRRADYTAAKQTVVNGRWGSRFPDADGRERSLGVEISGCRRSPGVVALNGGFIRAENRSLNGQED